MDISEKIAYLSDGCGRLGLEFSEDKYLLMLKYMDEVLVANQTTNLTSVTDAEGFIELHILDSLSVCPFIPENTRILDIGTGAGFPGIILKIARDDIKLSLMDSTLKKLDFIRSSCEKLGIFTEEIIHSRAEELSVNPIYRQSYDVVISRAVASLPLLCEYSIPYVVKGGLFIAMKGKNAAVEISAAKDISEKLGSRQKKPFSFELPYSSSGRCLIIYEKISNTPKEYPRKNSILKKLYK